MKTLILSCNTGEGHNSCAKAIKEYFDSKKEVCIIQDGLEFISPRVSDVVSRGHAFIYRRMPFLFKYGYEYSEKHPKLFHEGSSLYKFFTQGTERIFDYICEGQFDVVICTHVFTALMMTDILKRHPMKLTTCFVATDYTCSPSTKDSNLDFYFIPGHEFATDFECSTITEDKLIASGIPVRQMFYDSSEKEKAKSNEGVAPHHKHMIMMCGSMGCGPMQKLIHKLSVDLPANWEISVICGNNSKLVQKLEHKYSDKPYVHIRGFIKDMGMMMDSADLYLSKPGGISVTEAMVKGLPMVFVDAVAGCEEYNRIHFIRSGGAKTGATTDEIVDVCQVLMKNDAKRKCMSNCLNNLEKYNSAKIIYDQLKKSTEGINGTN